ncbi:TPA: hypothetical protein ACL8T8_002054 [Streptococcus pneumoniae]|uniref:hypothetical protein n=1 Tax=Streptococcus pneumoniae TaxID=1313 RepID=UPI0029597EE4|nr:hypothetical protein [Streptococcus pneumoniae]MDV8472877.1 hypothetical protein [Streptococcus pneumoniae]
MVKLFDLCYSEYAWDSLSKWFIGQFYFTKTIATMQKSNGKSAFFFRDKRLLSQTLSTGWRIR